MAPRTPSFPYDFAVYDRDGHVVALFEAKRRKDTDRSWATAWHETIARTATGATAATVVLVALDRVYGWRPHAEATASPDWSEDARSILHPYFERLRIEPSKVAPSVFETVVGMWLRDLAGGWTPEAPVTNEARDLISAIRDGEVVEQVAE
jgi:hypothetical protein